MVLERFLRYVQIDTQSSEDSTTFPSTEKQKNLARLLCQELRDLGVSAEMDEEYGYVYGKLPANWNYEDGNGDKLTGDAGMQNEVLEKAKRECKTLGFIAHMDTSPEVSGTNVHPQIIKNYQGGDIVLSEGKERIPTKDISSSDSGSGNRKPEQGYILSPKDFPELLEYIGKDLVTTDGSTLLGADDKAGVAEIMSMVEYLQRHPEIKHGPIAIAFTPDEEVGAGVDYFDVKRFGADYAYTVDGGGIGELEYENFNAAGAVITVTGRNVHPGEAKDKMKNAALLAMELNSRLPETQRPEHTSGYEGFYHLTHMDGCVEHAKLSYIIRDHDRQKFEEKKELLVRIMDALNEKYGLDTFVLKMEDQYYNMKEVIEPDFMFLVERAGKCMEDLGITPKIQPIRGGTDGARLSFMGIPCPNLCTCGHNYHGRFEYCCVQSMEQIVKLLVALAKKD